MKSLKMLQDLLEWVAQAEKKLGSEQQLSDDKRVLDGQAKDHKVTMH